MKKQLFILLAILSAPTFAAQNTVNTKALQACTIIENNLERLLCYDNVIAGKSLSKSQISEVATPEPVIKHQQSASMPIQVKEVTKKVATQEAAVPDNFGLEHEDIIKEKEKHPQLQAVVTKVIKAPHGELIITLNNNQQWRQVGTKKFYLKENENVTISRGIFSAFLLKKAGQNRTITVKRTK
ncbi:hypothetical protein [Thalassotalea piscium]|uniref:Type IV pilus biogenesis protein PilP n=1 Tax=Thalassotalea piscium TaxID=1230533 RepID=A0A7X0NHQ6_9GAMM|nr:hypothetical protein [Thalassotalea piscium]MBB6543575.1 hypothetical protein [Thalassotalea piscium]